MYTILLVDDDEFLIDIYSRKFTQEGLDVVTASSVEQPLEKMRSEKKFHAVIVDVLMPGMSGLDILKVVTDENLCPNCARIVLSNQGQQSDIDAAKEYNIDGYIIKASSVPSEVVQKVLSIIKNKNG